MTQNTKVEWLRETKNDVAGVPKRNSIPIKNSRVTKQLKKDIKLECPWARWISRFFAEESYFVNVENCRALQDWLTTKQMLQWLTKYRTVLVIKDREKRNTATNFRPITCLPLGDELYEHLEEQNLLPDEKNGCE